MKIYIGADHRGFSLKEKIYEYLKKNGDDVVDVGARVYESEDDEVDFAELVCQRMESDDRGILLCGSGHGMDMAANRFSSIRAIIGFNLDVTMQAREHSDANVLILPADWMLEDEAIETVKTFLQTAFLAKEKYVRRLEKLRRLS